MKPPRKLHIKSYGCQMNVYDAQRMVDTLAGEGFVETERAEDADLVILNTCHIREKASEKVYSELGRLRVVRVSTDYFFPAEYPVCIAHAGSSIFVLRYLVAQFLEKSCVSYFLMEESPDEIVDGFANVREDFIKRDGQRRRLIAGMRLALELV